MKDTSAQWPFHRLLAAMSHSWVAKQLVQWRGRMAIIALTILAIAFFILSYLIHQPGTQRVDYTVTRYMQAHRSYLLDVWALGFTILGNTPVLIGIGLVAAALMYWRKRPRAALLCVFSLVGVPLNYAIKGLFDRPRPDSNLVEVLAPTVGLSFPSGHAMASTALFGFLGLLCWLHAPTPRSRFLGVVGFASTAGMVSLSRVYLGAHWLSDVIGGMTAGIIVLLLFAEVYKRWNKEPFAPGSEK
jgi:undecaprenyl-diphosphatase